MRKLIVCLFLAMLAACAGQDKVEAPADFVPDSRPMGKTYVYECADIEFMTRVGPGEMALWLEDRYVVLSQVRAASGTKYQEGDILFWSKGQEAILEVDGLRYSDCEINHARAPWEDARRRGVNFRAVGNEPAWSLEIRDGQNILFRGDYGSTVLLFPDQVKSENGDVREYAAEASGHRLSVVIDNAFCRDTMADVEYPFSVTIELDGRRYRGCGRDLDYPWE
ncbi:hypothetical protein EY643_13265 [Halioglobus maricola]|uniref:C-type lysozyme inhibitor domain-containing protein n=1 Tax=Halioglobus maricola TaxID=2601894 RepID=A0A5P9NNR5_9GAMM|nr:MliC family protein [Halioglobus maricola]QFU76548.1 hypothetical protein EY643_13265 [Halioglobus maricola]